MPTLSPKQLTALSTLASDAAIEGRMTFDEVVKHVFAALLKTSEPVPTPQVFIERSHPTGEKVVALGMREVAALLRLQREARIGHEIQAALEELDEWRSGKRVADGHRLLMTDLRASLAYETGHCGGDIDDDGHYVDLAERCRATLGPIVHASPSFIPPTVDEDGRTIVDGVDLSLPPASLPDGVPVDNTERDPVEVRTFGVGPVSPEAEAMRFKSSRTWPFGQPFAVLRRAYARLAEGPWPSTRWLENQAWASGRILRQRWNNAIEAEVAGIPGSM